jgi:hypothetical protein
LRHLASQAVSPEQLQPFIYIILHSLFDVCLRWFFSHLNFNFNLTRIMDLEKAPTSHEPSTPPHRVQHGEAGAGAGASPKNVVFDKEDGNHDESSISTTALEEPVAAREEKAPEDDTTRPETPPEAKRSKATTALIMSALCVWPVFYKHKN